MTLALVAVVFGRTTRRLKPGARTAKPEGDWKKHVNRQTIAIGLGLVQAAWQSRRGAKEAAAAGGGASGPGGVLGGGGSAFLVAPSSGSDVRFDDIGGQAEAVRALRDVADFVRDRERFAAVGASPPKGVLLYGPPGCGKTLLAKALARESNATFYSASGSSFVEVYSGLGAKRIRELFADARARAPSVVFIDEIDALAKRRSGGAGPGGNEEREQALNQLLCELDGFASAVGPDGEAPNVVVVAATNRIDALDDAAIRSGRFDRHVRVVLPDEAARLAILRGVKGPKLAEGLGDSVLPQVAAATAGRSGADLAALMNDASLRAARRAATAVEAEDLLAALDAVEHEGEQMDPEAFGDITHSVKRRVAAHEAGHALAALVDDRDKRALSLTATIVPRSGGSAGHVTLKPSREAPKDEPHTRASLLSRLRILLAGREAEAIFLGDDHVSVMAESDVAKALGVAKALARFGFDSQHAKHRNGPSVDEDNEARKFLENERRNVHRALADRKDALRDLADALLARNTLDDADLRAIYESAEARRKIPPLVRWVTQPFDRKQTREAALPPRHHQQRDDAPAPLLSPAADQLAPQP